MIGAPEFTSTPLMMVSFGWGMIEHKRTFFSFSKDPQVDALARERGL
jgi:hypothetical protein